MKAREAIKLLEANGWKAVRQKGSHRVFKHPNVKEIITLPIHSGVDLKPGLLNSIVKIAGLKL